MLCHSLKGNINGINKKSEVYSLQSRFLHCFTKQILLQIPYNLTTKAIQYLLIKYSTNRIMLEGKWKACECL